MKRARFEQKRKRKKKKKEEKGETGISLLRTAFRGNLVEFEGTKRGRGRERDTCWLSARRKILSRQTNGIGNRAAVDLHPDGR